MMRVKDKGNLEEAIAATERKRPLTQRLNIKAWESALVVGGLLGGVWFGLGGTVSMPALAFPSMSGAAATDDYETKFSVCSGGTRINCIVDGDTFWHQGVKIRISDIDTPEISEPKCASEKQRGEMAKMRLLNLLNAGPFSLDASFRDEDQYGRKLRTVYRKGQSIGEFLVNEGHARAWDGARHSWC